MIKQTPSWKGLAAMFVFAFGCFGILMWLWISFGGSSPLKPQSYRVKAHFPESSLLVDNADVRISGLTVGHVAKKQLSKTGGQIVEMDIDRKYGPVPEDTRAILRAKSILGQIYIELTPGSRDAEKVPDGGTLRRSQVEDTIYIDEILSTFDDETRKNFRGWVDQISKAIDDGRGRDLNEALGKIDTWVASGADVLEILDDQNPALQRLIRNGSITLEAINERRGQFRELIGNANDVFEALASRNDKLAETISILPTFLDESKATVERLEGFSRNARPLVRDLTPVAYKLQPTIRDVGRLAPDLETMFRRLPTLIDESDTTLPEAAKFLDGAGPLLESLHVYLQQLNPVLSFLNYEQEQVADFIMNGGASMAGVLPSLPGEGPRHYLRQFSLINSRSSGIATTRPSYDRGNAYPAPNWYKRKGAFGIGESWDCKPTNGEKKEPSNNEPPCFVQPPQTWDGKQFPRLEPGGKVVDKPQATEGTKPAAFGG